METHIKHNGSSPVLKVILGNGEILKAQEDSLMVTTHNIEITPVADGDSKAAKRRVLAGEAEHLQQYKAIGGDGMIILGTGDDAPVGSIIELDITPKTPICVYKGNYFASTRDIFIDVQKIESSNRLKDMIIKGRDGRDEGNIAAKIHGVGVAFIYGYGSIEQIDLDIEQEVIIDSNNLLAWPADMEIYIDNATGCEKKDKLIGEAQIFRAIGPGKILIQTGKKILKG